MDEWEFYAVIEKDKTPQIENLIEEEIFVSKFCAETAKKILSVSKHYHINADCLNAKISNWIRKIENEVDTNAEIR